MKFKNEKNYFRNSIRQWLQDHAVGKNTRNGHKPKSKTYPGVGHLDQLKMVIIYINMLQVEHSSLF